MNRNHEDHVILCARTSEKNVLFVEGTYGPFVERCDATLFYNSACEYCHSDIVVMIVNYNDVIVRKSDTTMVGINGRVHHLSNSRVYVDIIPD